MKAFDATGMRFSRLVAVRRVQSRGGKTFWLFSCDCGAAHEASLDFVKRGLTRSCGCLARESASIRNATHGHTRGGKVSRAFGVWRAMKARCLNPHAKSYPDYGGRGISVCDRWMIFANFLADMGEPGPGLELDRADNEGGYSPDNCRWVNKRESVANRRNTVWADLDGERVTVSQAAETLGVKYSSLLRRVRAGEAARPAAECIAREVKRRHKCQASPV